MHIKCIFQSCRSPGRASSGLFPRSGSALATASYHHFIVRKHTYPAGSCVGLATLTPALVGCRWGWQLLGRSPLACRPPGPPSAPIGEPNESPNPPGRQPPRTMQALPLLLLQQVPTSATVLTLSWGEYGQAQAQLRCSACCKATNHRLAGFNGQSICSNSSHK